MKKALVNGTIFSGKDIISKHALVFENGLIDEIIPERQLSSNIERTDCEGNNIAPGFLDLQIAGSGGYLFSANLNTEALGRISASIVKSGTTGFLLVLPTNSPEIYSEAFKVVKSSSLPSLLGLHLEGPFINPVKRGAHDPDYIRTPDDRALEDLLKRSEGTIKMMTIAPELCNKEFIRKINDSGIICCAGHSNATFEEARRGFTNGISALTHLFNAQSPVHHRDPGLPGAAFLTADVYASIVADGIHVSYPTLSIAKKIMGERLYLVSDAVEESTQKAVQHVRKADRFTLPDGTLSGSVLTMMQAVKNCVEHAGIELDEAIRMASEYPARVMNIKDRGKLEPGMRADIVIFSPGFNVKKVIVSGNILN